MISLAQDYAVSPQTRLREARVLNQNYMQADDLIKRQRIIAGLENRPSPPLQSIARRLLALDLKTGPAVSQQEEASSARDDTGSGLPDHFIRLASERTRAELFERLRSANDRIKRRGAEQIVSDFVAAGRSRR